MSRLSWYWHRLRAMSPGEVARHLRKKFRQKADAKRTTWPEVDLTCTGAFPQLPPSKSAPESLQAALRRDADDILAGRWRFFGHLELKVDDPPKWQCDYLVGRDMQTTASAFQLNYRTLPSGVDSKLIWEPSRWYQLVRLAMAAYVLNDGRAAGKCLDWLEDWVRHNPPYRGWNWTSALEVGIRLIQFTWIDALLAKLTDPGNIPTRLAKLRREILPPHVWYAWRHRSFGSSANNHLLGELVGCIVATARWPGLACCGASLETLASAWHNEVVAQFAKDGGNQEQALNYQLFSWEFCWQALLALQAAGQAAPKAIEDRLRKAARFFVQVQVPEDPWDYGDSDSAYVTPFFGEEATAVAEWHRWFQDSTSSPALGYWLGTKPIAAASERGSEAEHWHQSKPSGYAMRPFADWRLRWDLSPLGLGSMAAHGHLDALHLSLWVQGVALIVDPGTGAYHADKSLRNWLASRAAHNGPVPESEEWPKRLGPFLWAETHPSLELESDPDRPHSAMAELITPTLVLGRSIEFHSELQAMTVTDWVESRRDDRVEAGRHFVVRWQFAPDTRIEVMSTRCFRATRQNAVVEIEVSPSWEKVSLVTDPAQARLVDPDAPLAGTVSARFRQTVWAPYLKLTAQSANGRSGEFTTIFRRG